MDIFRIYSTHIIVAGNSACPMLLFRIYSTHIIVASLASGQVIRSAMPSLPLPRLPSHTKTRICFRNYSPINRESNNEAIKSNTEIVYSPPPSSSVTKAAARSPRLCLCLAKSKVTSHKSQVTSHKSPHAACNNGPVYIDASWRWDETHEKILLHFSASTYTRWTAKMSNDADR
jgi:hypothetical protein